MGKVEINLQNDMKELGKNGDSKLGKLVTTSVLKNVADKADVVIINSGGIRSALMKGTVTYGD